mmetsp:Transcript_2189/g.4203  ORF Transcript_2189/g.4203 Transcript_2189/m.4203 type:complete len:528 (-) Transcript_2189:229-1812(-)
MRHTGSIIGILSFNAVFLLVSPWEANRTLLRGLVGFLFLVLLLLVGEDHGVWVDLSELEHLLHGLQLVLHPLHLLLGVPQVGHGAVQQLRNDALRNSLDCVPLFLREPSQHLLSLGQLLLTDSLALLTEHLDGGDAAQRLLPALEVTDLALNQHLGFLNGGHALLLVRVDDLLEVVDVVRDDTLGLLRVVVHVDGHADIHEHQLLPVARVLLQGGLRDQRILGERGGEHDVRVADLVPHLVQGVQGHVHVREHLREPLHALAAAVDDVQRLLGVRARKVSHEQPGHLSGTDDGYPRVLEVHAQVFLDLHLGQLSRSGRDRDSSLRDARFGAHSLSGGHRHVEQLAKHLSEATVFVPAVGGTVLHLAENLALADDEGVQATRDAQHVVDRFGSVVKEQVWVELVLCQTRLVLQEVHHFAIGLLCIMGHIVHLKSVAGRQNSSFLNRWHSIQTSSLCLPFGFRNSEFLSYTHISCVMAQSHDVDGPGERNSGDRAAWGFHRSVRSRQGKHSRVHGRRKLHNSCLSQFSR